MFQRIPLRTPTIPPAQHTNCYVLGHDAAVVVDPGSAFDGELGLLREVLWRLRGTGGTVAAVILTHHHADHVGGAAIVAEEQGVPVAAHPLTLSRLPWTPRRTEELAQGGRLRVHGKRELVVHHTPGHAPGHVCLWDPVEGVLLAGDMIPGQGTVLIDPTDGDMKEYLDSLARLARLEPRRILPAHGPELSDGRAALERLIQHRLWRESRVVEALAAGPADLWSLTRAAYADQPALLWPLCSRSTRSHLVKLEHEGRVVREHERWMLP